MTQNPIPLKLVSTDGKTVRIEFDYRTLTTEQAHAFAHELSHQAALTENMPERHQRHVDLLASCPLCVYEVNGQYDRLTYDELMERADEPGTYRGGHSEVGEPDTFTVPVREGRLSELLDGKFVVVELQPKLGSTRKRTVMGFAHAAGVRSFEVDDKAGRRHIIDVELVQRARVNPGGNGEGVFTAIEDGRIVR